MKMYTVYSGDTEIHVRNVAKVTDKYAYVAGNGQTRRIALTGTGYRICTTWEEARDYLLDNARERLAAIQALTKPEESDA